MSKIRILHIITGLPIGGAEKVLLDLCRHLDHETIENHIVGLNDERAFFPQFQEAAASVTTLDMTKSLSGALDAAKALLALAERHRIDIVHAHMFHPIIFAYLLKMKRPATRIVFTSHNENIGGALRDAIVFATRPFRDADILFSEKMRRLIYKRGSVVIPNGIDTAQFRTPLPKKERFTFVAVGVLREQKNHKILPSIAAKLKEKGYDFVIEIVGSADASGDTSAQIEEEIRKYDVADRVKMVGARRDIPEVLLRSHCFVMPSLFEGLPIALLEAGAAALPVVSTPVGAIVSVVDETCGYLCEAQRFDEAMAEVIDRYEEACERGRRLQKRVRERFSIEAMARAHEELYRSLI